MQDCHRELKDTQMKADTDCDLNEINDTFPQNSIIYRQQSCSLKYIATYFPMKNIDSLE
jgi:hypothetical protein